MDRRPQALDVSNDPNSVGQLFELEPVVANLVLHYMQIESGSIGTTSISPTASEGLAL